SFAGDSRATKTVVKPFVFVRPGAKMGGNSKGSTLMLIRSSLTVLAFAAAVATVSAQEALIGVLEEVPGIYAGESSWRRVRVVFRKEGNEWQAFTTDCER